MDSTKIEFYNALKQEQKYILNVAALYASDFDAYRLRNVLSSTTPYTLALIQKTIDLGLKVNFITQENKNSYKCASPDFMVYIYPSIKDYTQEIKLIDDSFRFHWQPKGLRVFSKFLRALLFEERSTAKEEEDLLLKGDFPSFQDALWSIFDNSSYQKHLSKLSSQLVNALMNYKMRENYRMLEPLTEIAPLYDQIKPHLNPEIQEFLPSPRGMITILEGNFTAAIQLFENANPALTLQLLAANQLINNRVDEAYLLFEKGIKSERVTYKNRYIPTQIELSIFYFIALAQQPAEKALPIYTKICTSLEKKPLFNLDLNLRAICYYAINQKQSLKSIIDYINNSQYDTPSTIDHLINTIIFYLTEREPTKEQISDYILAVKKAHQNGYLLLAYEATYALLKWCKDATLTTIFDQLATKFQYQPAISQISFLENWEQALNGLLDASAGTKQVKSSTTDESKARIIYYVDPLENIIQPVLQTRSKTGWSTGRNIALKTFSAGNVEGMTEQDYRIAKQVQRYSGGYYGSDVYEFKESAIKELV
ncbi:MAG: hypothetical protein KBG80_11240, partial [Breznakibacter sp.]|nr:hypothetical protein [Breznakibacter sp.]